MIRILMCLSLAAVAVLGGGACSRKPDTTPPQIRYGEQECDACRMLVSDERFAAALVFERDGHVTKLVFDDINCVFSYLSDHPAGGSYSVYTHDLDTRAWLNARMAFLVRSDKLETPMASKIAAASTADEAENLLKRYPGERLTFDQVAKRFTRSTSQGLGQEAKAP
ncbi:MAG: nitrous oxide reductase accessory protein NosL [Phycisphaerae bacterium]|nr:nitrous oxide reductase accessory protein NosL [Phycisphaerae bacterium]